ncbi:MAG: PAS domain S-box protein [Actinobacteria bacterium]|nr:PAS domain S-box protein [Actinomycetota bacterium]
MAPPNQAPIGLKIRNLDHELPLFERFLEFVPDAVVGIDADGEIRFVNHSSEMVFGYPRGELVGRSLNDLLPERFRERHAKHREGYFADPRTRPMGAGIDLFGLRADGSEFPAEISLSMIHIGDEPFALSAIRDITDRVGAERERKRLETELKLNQSRRLESIGQLAGGVAHDFNNLLAVIMNYAEFVATSVQDRPKVRDDVEQIQSAAKRAAALTRQLLTFSRREMVKPRPLDVNEVLANLEKLLRRTIGEDIHLSTKFEPDIWTVVADPGQLEQIVMNLTVNARDAMPSGGILEIETQNVELDDEFTRQHPDSPAPGRYVRLTVSDTGTGMPPDVAVRAFEPFFTTKAEGEGTGLGLATVYGIVKAAGGNVLIYSEKDHGTAVKIHLPASDAQLTLESEHQPSETRGQGEVVVVVEDEESVRILVKRVLTGNGYEVVAFSRAREAIEMLRDADARVDLLLTDVVMPEMQGSELAAEAQILRPGLRISFMSGYSETLVERMDAAEAARNLIEKPFTSVELLAHVRESLDRETG